MEANTIREMEHLNIGKGAPRRITGMKKTFLIIALVLVLVLPLAAAKPSGVGVGVTGGYPFSGAAVKYGMGDFSFVGTLGYNYNKALSIEGGAQYDVYDFAIGDIPFSVNAGVTAAVSIGFSGGFALSANVPVGLSYFFDKMPIELFLKFTPGVAILPKIGFYWGASIGGLYYLDI